MKILDSIWFSPGGCMKIIGIVKTMNLVKDIKYYIGTVAGLGEEGDANYIADYGAHFPFNAGEKLFNIK